MLRRVGTLSARLGRRSKSTALNVEVNQQGVAVLRLDCPGEVQNTLSMELIQEFDEVRTRTHAACERSQCDGRHPCNPHAARRARRS